MRSRALLVVVLVSLSYAAVADEDWRTITPAEVTREQWATAQKQAAAFMGHVGPSKNPSKTSTPSQMVPPRELGRDELAALVARVQRSFYVGDAAGGDLQLDGDVYFVPALEPGSLEVHWQRVVDGKGKNVLVKEVDDGQPAIALHRGALSYQRQVKITTGAVPVRADGTGKLVLPVSWRRIDLPCKAGSVGETKGITAKVRQCAGDFVELELDTPKRPVLVVTDKEGRAIESEFRESSPVFTGGRTFGQLKYEDLPVAPIAARLAYRTKGLVGAVSLYFVDRTEERSFPVAAITSAARGSVRTQYEPKVCTGLVRTTASAVRAAMHVDPTRSYATASYNTPEVRLTLPRLDNSFYARVEVGDAKVTDANGHDVPHEAGKGLLVWPEPTDELILESGKQPLAFAHAKGTMKVRYPTEMHLVKLTKAHPHEGTLSLALRGTHAVLSDSRGADELRPPSFGPGCLDLVRAYDARGERLVKLGHEAESDDGQRDLALWGTPVEVDVVVVDRWDDLAIDYDVQPAPMLPEGHEGETPE